MPMSELVIQTCEQHYAKRCAGCPIERQCKPATKPHTAAELDAWEQACHGAALVAMPDQPPL